MKYLGETSLTHLISKIKENSSTSNYNDLTNKPQINNVELTGNKTLEELGIQAAGDYATTEDVANAINEAIGTALESEY